MEIHYAIGGTGEPVFLVHGVPKTMAYWRHVVPLLTPHFTVIVLDNRGAGGSQRVQQLVFQGTLLPGLPVGPGMPGGGPDPSLAADDGRTGWHFSFFSLPHIPELLLAGREGPFWRYYARRQMWDPSALAEEDVNEIVHSAEQPGGTRAILEMYRARQTDAEQNRPHYAAPLSCPVLAVGAEEYLGDAVAQQMAQVADDVHGVVIPAAGHNIALENPTALAQAYLDFFAAG
ncbi:alpha/beta fold hydrolase [Streptomyces flaveolus]|uniref:alpha/beta fold hydrolase n=1 Tax=Streptomyces flaveolus TaxID=67297 RepID=UPI00344AE3A9